MSLSTPVLRSTIADGTDRTGTDYVGTSGTPSANALLIAFVVATTAAPDPDIPVVVNSPWGVSWLRVETGDLRWTETGAVRRSGWVFCARTDSTAPASDTFDVNFGSGTVATGCAAICFEYTGANISVSPLRAINQCSGQKQAATPYSAPTLLPAFNSDNRSLAFYACNTTGADVWTADTAGNWTDLAEAAISAPTVTGTVHYNSGFDTTPTATTAGNQAAGAWSMEIVVDQSQIIVPPQPSTTVSQKPQGEPTSWVS